MKLIDNLNNKLTEYNQISRITFYSANPKKVILNNIEYCDNLALRIIRRINGDEHWIRNFDKIYLTFEINIEKKIKSLISKKGGKACQSIHGENIKKNLNTGIPWNKTTKGNYPYSSWCKGLTKETDKRLEALSSDRMGKGNPMFGTEMSQKDKDQKSITMKQKILDGCFTPNSNNRNTHWDSCYRDKKFRSSWEAIYYSLNKDDLYESLRIKYIYDSKEYIYIVDFINHNTKTVTEIKPRELLDRDKEKSKIESLSLWCKNNDYKMNIITQEDIQQMSVMVCIEDFDSKTQKKIKALNEAYNKKRDR